MSENTRWRLATLAATLVALAIYLPLASPGLQFGDSAEFQTVAIVGGIPHSSGYPSYILLGRLFTAILPGEPVFRATLVSVVFGAATVGLFLPVFRQLGVGLAAATLAAFGFGLSFSFWRATQRAEVYTLSVAIALLALHRTLVAVRSGRFRDAVLAGFLMGLTLTGHLSFLVPVGLGGLVLAWIVFRRQPNPVPRLAGLLGAFLLGLTPYAYILWADARHVPANFLGLVDHARALLGPGGPPFDHPLDRLRWLMFGRNTYPPRPFEFHPRFAVLNLFQCGVILFLFELGPVALAAFLAGVRAAWRDNRARAVLLGTGFATTAMFTAVITGGPMLHLFLLPTTMFAALFAGFGLDRGVAWLRARGVRGAAGAAAWVLAALVMVAPPALLRVYADAHPIGPRHWKVLEEDKTLHTGLVPSMEGYREPEQYGRSALEHMPAGALVLAHWTEFAVLRHLQMIEALRPDVTVDQATIETVRARIGQWRAAHPGGGAPIVFTSHGLSMDPFASEVDSIPVATGRYLYVLREAAPVDSAR